MNTLRRSALTLAFLFLMTGAAFGQFYSSRLTYGAYNYWRGPSTSEVSYSYVVGFADFKYRYNNFNENTGELTDTSFTKHLTTTGGFGACGGYYWPVTKLAEKTRLAITASYLYNFMLWDGDLFNYAASNTGNVNGNVGSATGEMAIPIGLDYKYGCDGMKDKSERFCYSFGAGVYPSMDITIYKDAGGLVFRARPFVKAEVGLFAGICMKLRFMYAAGNVDYIKYESSGPGWSESTKFTSKGTAMFSIVFMPLSWKWGSTEWWNN